jgi:hypothetical protein
MFLQRAKQNLRVMILITILLQIVNAIFDHGSVPDILKVGLLIPVFKNKGNIAEVINYRGTCSTFSFPEYVSPFT